MLKALVVTVLTTGDSARVWLAAGEFVLGAGALTLYRRCRRNSVGRITITRKPWSGGKSARQSTQRVADTAGQLESRGGVERLTWCKPPFLLSRVQRAVKAPEIAPAGTQVRKPRLQGLPCLERAGPALHVAMKCFL